MTTNPPPEPLSDGTPIDPVRQAFDVLAAHRIAMLTKFGVLQAEPTEEADS